MKKKIDFTLIISTILCLSPIILGITLYDRLPDSVAIHFNVNNEPDNYVSKSFAVFALPALMAALNIIVNIFLDNDPKKAHFSTRMRNLFKWFIPVLTILLESMTLFIAIGVKIELSLYVPLFVSIIFIVIGNYLPKIKQNYTMGIKLPWTLHSEENWNKTHHLAGYLWMIGGVLMVISCFIGNISFPISIIVILMLVIIPIIYSYVLYKKGI
ncbi:SdpI family protein [Sedimentibacter sp. zth1]|nr:SdpI family protein [Sedimentibacter sp. zth1]